MKIDKMYQTKPEKTHNGLDLKSCIKGGAFFIGTLSSIVFGIVFITLIIVGIVYQFEDMDIITIFAPLMLAIILLLTYVLLTWIMYGIYSWTKSELKYNATVFIIGTIIVTGGGWWVLFLLSAVILKTNLFFYKIFNKLKKKRFTKKEEKIEKMTNVDGQEKLKRLVIEAKDPEIKLSLMEKIEDQQFLAELAKKSLNEDVAIKAIEKLNDTDLLTDIAKNDINENCRLAALNRLQSKSFNITNE